MMTIERRVFMSWLKAFIDQYSCDVSAIEAGEAWALEWLRAGVDPRVMDVFCEDPRNGFTRGIADALDYWRVTPEAER